MEMLKARLRSRSKKGFTLIEMLIVVAIIAVLIAIAIPTFSNQLNKAKIGTDQANLRAAKSLSVTTYLLDETNPTGAVNYAITIDDQNNLVAAQIAGTTSDTAIKPNSGAAFNNVGLVVTVVEGKVTANTWETAQTNPNP